MERSREAQVAEPSASSLDHSDTAVVLLGAAPPAGAAGAVAATATAAGHAEPAEIFCWFGEMATTAEREAARGHASELAAARDAAAVDFAGVAAVTPVHEVGESLYADAEVLRKERERASRSEAGVRPTLCADAQFWRRIDADGGGAPIRTASSSAEAAALSPALFHVSRTADRRRLNRTWPRRVEGARDRA